MRWKLTLGMTRVSTRLTILPVSPAWIAGSSLIACNTSLESLLISASGASSAACAAGRATIAEKPNAAATKPL